jgi:hypothetical protein
MEKFNYLLTKILSRQRNNPTAGKEIEDTSKEIFPIKLSTVYPNGRRTQFLIVKHK